MQNYNVINKVLKKDKSEKTMFEVKRNIDSNTKFLLLAKAGGRCEICNVNLLKDDLTQADLIWGEMAHIYAFSRNGPRPSKKIKREELNKIGNLILTCPTCHNKIDKPWSEKYYTVEILKKWKLRHEKRINLVTSFTDDRRTRVLKMVANINGEKVVLSVEDMVITLMEEKLFSDVANPIEIDFADNSGFNNAVYWKGKRQEIDETVGKFLEGLIRDKVKHISVFAIGPIPLLICLGSKLQNKIKTKIFQRHRDGERWTWSKSKPEAFYKFRLLNKGKDRTKVALLISLSGSVDRTALPKKINKDYFIYEIYLSSANPNYNFLRTERDLQNFEVIFTTAISQIKNAHKELKFIDFFPAIPAPVAVVCGRNLNKNSDPSLRIFNRANKKVFNYTLTIN